MKQLKFYTIHQHVEVCPLSGKQKSNMMCTNNLQDLQGFSLMLFMAPENTDLRLRNSEYAHLERKKFTKS